MRWIRVCALLGIAALTLVILLTQSRGGMLALGTLYALAFVWQRRKVRALVYAALGCLVVVSIAPEKVFSRLGGLAVLAGGVQNIQEVDPEQSAASRYAIWRVAMHIWRTRPITSRPSLNRLATLARFRPAKYSSAMRWLSGANSSANRRLTKSAPS